MTPLVQSPWLLALYAGLLLLAALQDVIQLKISNILVVAIFLVALAGVGLTAPSGQWWQHLVSFALVFAAGFLFFARGWFGGGDAKLLAASSLAFPLGSLLWFVTSVAIFGGVIAILLLTLRMFARRTASDVNDASGAKAGNRGRSIPYGVAITAGALFTALFGAQMASPQLEEPPVYLQPLDG